MFTGIIQTIGQITHISPLYGDGQEGHQATGVNLTLSVQPESLLMQGLGLGDSIAIQGACMTVTALLFTGFTVDVSAESLSKTTGLTTLGAVNLEKALSLNTPLGGHLVTGHVDGLGYVAKASQIGESWELVITAPLALAKFFAIKGSAVINGVSLTINTLLDHEQGCDLSFNLIPHTWQNTTLCQLTLGMSVNLEIDLIARYLERMVSKQ